MRPSLGLVVVAGCCLSNAALAFLPPMSGAGPRRDTTVRRMAQDIDLEGGLLHLDGQKEWDVTMTWKGESKVVKVHEGTSLLDAAEKAFGEAPHDCRNGVCTTCAALLKKGQGSYQQAIDSLSPDQSSRGYILTCQTYPTGPGLEVELGKYDEVYEDQFGKNQKEGAKKIAGEKKWSLFG